MGMNQFTIFVAAVLAGTSVGVFAQAPAAQGGTMTATAPGKGVAANVVEITATVQEVNKADRTVTIKGPKGNVDTVTVGPEVKNFDQIKVGDQVALRYVAALSLELKKGGKAPVERTDSMMSGTAKPGEKPAAGAGRQVQVTANVVAVDAATQTVTLKGPQRTVSLHVGDPAQFKLVKVGDQVEATYTEAVALSVEPAAKK
jgi:Cu/Ag efflux protein CusF